MRWPVLIATTALGTALVGCDTIKDKIPFLSKADTDTTATDTTTVVQEPESLAAAPATDTTTMLVQEPEPQPEPEPEPPPPEPVRQVVTQQLVDEPWDPMYSGTVEPGMTPEEVIAVWGPPVAERAAGTRLYLYYRNGCEVTCGTFDVVFFEGGQVVDAIVRGMGHTYAGVSSSPPDRAPEYTPPMGSSSGVGVP